MAYASSRSTPRACLWVPCPSCRSVSGLMNISLSRGGRNHYECEECGQEWVEAPTLPPRRWSRQIPLPPMPLSELPMMKALLAEQQKQGAEAVPVRKPRRRQRRD